MAGTHPYISGTSNVAEMIMQLRKTFPPVVNADTVKKLGLASNNESYVINALQFIGIIDEEGKRTAKGSDVFSLSGEEFTVEFKKLIQEAYSDLYSIRHEEMWTLTREQLTTYFRKADKTSEMIGTRQARLFQTFAAFAGFGEVESKPKKSGNGKPSNNGKPPKSKAAPANKVEIAMAPADENKPKVGHRGSDVALTVRIEINLPAGGTKETYDYIFQSIKENLLND